MLRLISCAKYIIIEKECLDQYSKSFPFNGLGTNQKKIQPSRTNKKGNMKLSNGKQEDEIRVTPPKLPPCFLFQMSPKTLASLLTHYQEKQTAPNETGPPQEKKTPASYLLLYSLFFSFRTTQRPTFSFRLLSKALPLSFLCFLSQKNKSPFF